MTALEINYTKLNIDIIKKNILYCMFKLRINNNYLRKYELRIIEGIRGVLEEKEIVFCFAKLYQSLHY
jgi:hypothetical protein